MEKTDTSPEQPVDNSEDTVVLKRSHFYSIMVVFAFAVGILVGYMAWGRSGPVTPSAAQAAQAPAAAPAPEEQAPVYTRYDISTEGFPSLGPEDAEIVLVEFSDYQ